MRVREYVGPLRVLAAAVIGFSLLCSVSALAMNDLNSYDRNAMESLNIVDLAVENLSTSAALTQQAVTAFVPTPTVVPTDTASLAPRPAASDTATVRPSATPRQPTPTRRPRSTATASPLPPRTSTRTPLPTATSTPLPTNTEPLPTDTPLPTNTEPPPPPPTDTSPPPATDTESPPTAPPIQISDTTQTPSP